MSSFRWLGCDLLAIVGVELLGRCFAERLVRAFLVVKLVVANDSLVQRTRVNEFVDVDAFVLERAEEPLGPAVKARFFLSQSTSTVS